jgi:hypothetical protein
MPKRLQRLKNPARPRLRFKGKRHRRNFVNWREVSRNGFSIRELDSQSKSRITRRLNKNHTPLRLPLPESCPASSPGTIIAAQHCNGGADNYAALSQHIAGFPARHFSHQGEAT